MFDLGLDGYEKRIADALSTFWVTHARSNGRSSRSMRDFEAIVDDIVSMYGRGKQLCVIKGQPSIPSIFRPSKKWDIVVLNRHKEIVAAIELKSHTSGKDYEKNFNNRVEEALGTATDFHITMPYISRYIRSPFVGFFLLLEDNDASNAVKPAKRGKHFAIKDETVLGLFDGKNIIDRWQTCLDAFVNARIYNACGLLVAKRQSRSRSSFTINPSFSDERFFARFASYIDNLL